MNGILGRYIAKTIALATAFTALIMASVLFLMMVLGEFKKLGEGDYGLLQAVFYVILRLPNALYQFSPLLMLLGSLIGLSILSSHRELAVMRVSGFSIRRMIYSVLSIAFLLVLLMGLIGEVVAPRLSYRAEIQKENAQHGGEEVVTAAGVWFHVGNNFIHVQQVIGRQLLQGVTRYQFDDKHHLQAAYFAKTLSFQNHQWQMNDVVKTTFYNEQTKSESLQSVLLNLKFNPSLLSVGLVDANDMSLPRLAKSADYLKQNGLQATEYQYQFWQRIFQPFASLIMIFLAIPFVLGTFSTSTMGWRIVVGIMVGFIFFMANAFLGQLCVVYQLPAIFAALLPLVIFMAFGIVLSKQLITR